MDKFETGKVPDSMISQLESARIALPAGDYWIPKRDNGTIIIERSTYGDFVGKIKSGRLYKQVEKCLGYSDDVYFLIEGRWSKYTKFPAKSMVGMVASISRKVNVMWLDGPASTIHFLAYLHGRYAGDKKDVEIGRHKPKGMQASDMASFMLQAIPGIGPKTAVKMLENTTIAELGTKTKLELTGMGISGNELYEALHYARS